MVPNQDTDTEEESQFPRPLVALTIPSGTSGAELNEDGQSDDEIIEISSRHNERYQSSTSGIKNLESQGTKTTSSMKHSNHLAKKSDHFRKIPTIKRGNHKNVSLKSLYGRLGGMKHIRMLLPGKVFPIRSNNHIKEFVPNPVMSNQTCKCAKEKRDAATQDSTNPMVRSRDVHQKVPSSQPQIRHLTAEAYVNDANAKPPQKFAASNKWNAEKPFGFYEMSTVGANIDILATPKKENVTHASAPTKIVTAGRHFKTASCSHPKKLTGPPSQPVGIQMGNRNAGTIPAKSSNTNYWRYQHAQNTNVEHNPEMKYKTTTLEPLDPPVRIKSGKNADRQIGANLNMPRQFSDDQPRRSSPKYPATNKHFKVFENGASKEQGHQVTSSSNSLPALEKPIHRAETGVQASPEMLALILHKRQKRTDSQHNNAE